jgi:hypothetical protein
MVLRYRSLLSLTAIPKHVFVSFGHPNSPQLSGAFQALAFARFHVNGRVAKMVTRAMIT